jgi:hypothetical protein
MLGSHIKKQHNKSLTEYIKEYPKNDIMHIQLKKKIEKLDNQKEICIICNQKMNRITNTHLASHGYTIKEYREKYFPKEIEENAFNMIKCKICNKQFSEFGFHNHVKFSHMGIEDYISLFGEYNRSKIKNINEITRGSIECKLCGNRMNGPKKL